VPVVVLLCPQSVECRIHLTSEILVKMYRPLQILRDHLLPYWKTIIIIVVPLAMLPLPILAIGEPTEKVNFK